MPKRVQIEGDIGRNNFKFQCAKTGHEYASKITYMQVNMQLIGLGIASDLKGCMLDICRSNIHLIFYFNI